MLAIVYELKIAPEQERRFRDAWHEVTEEMKKHGSLGARLHLSDEGSWIAYAQWPNHETWQHGHRMIDDKIKQMHLDEYFLDAPVTLLKLTVVDDLLVLKAT